jgi:protein O-GlcNAc transferase
MASSSLRYAKKKKMAFDLYHLGRYEEAQALATDLCKKSPRDHEARCLLGHSLFQLGHLDDASLCFRSIVKATPNSWKAHADLANACHHSGNLEQAVMHFKEAARLAPGNASLWDNLGIALCCQGKYDEAAASHRRAMELDPRSARAHSNLLLTLHYLPAADPEELHREHVHWGEVHGAVPKPGSYTNVRDPDRRLRIGYVSADFRTHSVAYFIEPVIAAHDHDQVDVWCYAYLERGDATTERLRTLSDHWRHIAGQEPEAVARQIRDDRIDILIDLGGHTQSDLLRVFTQKPAPIQITYLGYPDTTGLAAMDYRLCDPITDPPEQATHCTEELLRLPDCFLCYRPSHEEAPPVTQRPVCGNGQITFGSFNNLAKINGSVVEVWSRLLQAVPGSRLFLKNPSLRDATTRERYAALFRSHGVSDERVEMQGPTARVVDHLALYRNVDIALDTFPYNGTTTTCEALWMGVPVITMLGATHASRVGASLLKNAGLGDLVAGDRGEYLEMSVALANAPDRLASLSHSLRGRVASSKLCDADRTTRNIEDAYRAVWKRYCAHS